MSGFGQNSDRTKSKSAGCREHIPQPFDPDELDKMLAEAARNSL